MFKISYFLIAFTLIMTFGCDVSKKETEKTDKEKDQELNEVQSPTSKLDYQIKTLIKKNNPCPNNDCSEVKVSYPQFTEVNNGTKTLNESIENKAQTMLFQYVMDAKASDDITTLMSSFIESHNLYKATFPDAKTNWFINISGKPTYRSDDFTSVRYELTSYSGGAHTIAETSYVNFSSKGKILSKLSYFFRDKQSIRTIAEQQFRKSKSLEDNESLNEAGFIFQNDKFTLTDNFGFSDTALIFYYNSSEISDFAEGATEVTISLDELKDNFRF